MSGPPLVPVGPPTVGPQSVEGDAHWSRRWAVVAGRVFIVDMVVCVLAASALVLFHASAGDGADTSVAADLVAGVAAGLWLAMTALGFLGSIVGLGMINDRPWAPTAATWAGGAYAALVLGVAMAAEAKITLFVGLTIAVQMTLFLGVAVIGTAVAANRYERYTALAPPLA